jgi:hypothetical protein
VTLLREASLTICANMKRRICKKHNCVSYFGKKKMPQTWYYAWLIYLSIYPANFEAVHLPISPLTCTVLHGVSIPVFFIIAGMRPSDLAMAILIAVHQRLGEQDSLWKFLIMLVNFAFLYLPWPFKMFFFVDFCLR